MYPNTIHRFFSHKIFYYFVFLFCWITYPVYADTLLTVNTDNNVVYEFDLTTGKLVGTFSDAAGHLDRPHSITLHPFTGNVFVADKTGIKQFDGNTGRYLGKFGEGNQSLIVSIRFNPKTGNLMIVNADGIVELDGVTGKRIRSFTGIRFLTDPTNGNLFIRTNSSTHNILNEYDGISGRFIRVFNQTLFARHMDSISVVTSTFSGNGNIYTLGASSGQFGVGSTPDPVIVERSGRDAKVVKFHGPVLGSPSGERVEIPTGYYPIHWDSQSNLMMFITKSRRLAYWDGKSTSVHSLSPKLNEQFEDNNHPFNDFEWVVQSNPSSNEFIKVTPRHDRIAAAWEGEPITPHHLKFRISNQGNGPIDYSITKNQNWLTLDNPTGTIPGRSSLVITATFNSNAQNLTPGKHTSTVSFRNLNNGRGNRDYAIELFMGPQGQNKLELTQKNYVDTCIVVNCERVRSDFEIFKDTNIKDYHFKNISGSDYHHSYRSSDEWFGVNLIGGDLLPCNRFNLIPDGKQCNFWVTINSRFLDIDYELETNKGLMVFYDSDSGELLNFDSITLDPSLLHKYDPRFSVIAPFWQHSGSSYTFVAVSHPSLSGMAPEIGLRATAFLGNGNQPYGHSQEFTVSAGQTERVFIYGQFHGLDFGGQDQPPGRVLLGQTGGTGYLRFDPLHPDPSQLVDGGFPDITMLSYWGSVVFQGSQTGFTMEFIGDLHDSSSHPGQTPGTMPSGIQ